MQNDRVQSVPQEEAGLRVREGAESNSFSQWFSGGPEEWMGQSWELGDQSPGAAPGHNQTQGEPGAWEV